jgi:hypothetical protein
LEVAEEDDDDDDDTMVADTLLPPMRQPSLQSLSSSLSYIINDEEEEDGAEKDIIVTLLFLLFSCFCFSYCLLFGDPSKARWIILLLFITSLRFLLGLLNGILGEVEGDPQLFDIKEGAEVDINSFLIYSND